jgi:hypothetical protein
MGLIVWIGPPGGARAGKGEEVRTAGGGEGDGDWSGVVGGMEGEWMTPGSCPQAARKIGNARGAVTLLGANWILRGELRAPNGPEMSRPASRRPVSR